MDQLSDAAARERIRSDLDATLFVEAGAGTGKTTVLVERVVQLVASGAAKVEAIAAITFTEAAAAELRDRVLVGLERASIDGARSGDERERCHAGLAGLDNAAIETLHAFAARILSLYPLEAGLPPGFDIVDEQLASTTFADRWMAHFDAMLDGDALRQPLLRAFALDVTPVQLRELAEAMHRDWDRAAEAAPLVLGRSAVTDDELRDIAERLSRVSSYESTCRDPEDRLAKHLRSLADVARRLATADDEFDRLGLIAGIDRIASNSGRAPNWQGPSKADIVGDLSEIDADVENIRARTIAASLPPIVESIRTFVLESAEARRKRGNLEFHDLLVLARNLLRDNETVRRALRRRFARLLIDEFQDTDPLQTEIAYLLAAVDDADTSSPEDALDEGRLFFVGDPKQSIYRFRRADIELYQRVQDRFDASTERLVQNFRSTPCVIDWVNAVFGRLIGDESRPGQAAYVALDAARPPTEGARVIALGGVVEANAEGVREAEAVELARVIRGLKDRPTPVFAGRNDDNSERWRDAELRDIAILAPTRTGLEQLLPQLEANAIPYRLESRSLVYDTPEVRDLLTILRAIDDPTNQVALVAALRSPAFACSDVSLFEYREAGGRWDYRDHLPESLEPAHPVIEGMRWLHDAYRERWWRPVATLVEQVIRERRLLELAFADRRQRDRWQRLRFLLDQARAFQDAGGRTLREFLLWAERQAADEVRIVEQVVPEVDEDAVRIMTVHAAKGLEFPIVVLCGLNLSPHTDIPMLIWPADRGAPEVRLHKKAVTPGYEEARGVEQELGNLERDRVLYVAATRARDHLIVSLYRPARGEANTPAGRIAVAMQQHGGDLAALAGPMPVPEEREPPEPPTADTVEDRAAWIARRDAVVTERAAVAAWSATALAQAAANAAQPEAAADPNLAKEPPAEELPPWRRGRAGTAIGRAVHSVLQTIDLATGEGVEAAARAQALAEGVPGRVDDVARAVRRALDSEAVRAAVASGRYWREVYVATPISGGATAAAGAPPGTTLEEKRTVLVEGFIDLLYEDESAGGYVVVDYKTDAVPSAGAVDAAVSRYRPQLAAYALALNEQLPRPVVRASLLFLGPATALERSLDDLEAAVEGVRAAVVGS